MTEPKRERKDVTVDVPVMRMSAKPTPKSERKDATVEPPPMKAGVKRGQKPKQE